MNFPPVQFRRYATFILTFVFLGWGAASLLRSLLQLTGIDIPIWIETPSGMAIATAMYAIYDKWLWAWKPLRWLQITTVPDLRGRWVGEIHSSYQDGTKAQVVLEITQTASKTVICLYSQKSKSVSLVSAYTREPNGQFVLHFAYRNDPAIHSDDTMHIHYGFGRLIYFSDKQELEGEYFTSRDRKTYGSIKVRFQRKALVHRFET